MKWGLRTGLTLLELLVALALLATILTALLAATRLGSNLLERTSGLDKEQSEIAARVRLRGWLQTAQPPQLITNIPIVFEGTANRFSFVTLSRIDFASQAAAVRINVVADINGLSIIAETLDDDGAVVEELHTSLNQSSEFIFSYWNSFAGDPIWQSDWTIEERIPNLVRITAIGENISNWPEWIVAPVLAGRH